ncbi:MAG: hypothetical protein ACSHXL_03785 [Bacteroidota bacterium]
MKNQNITLYAAVFVAIVAGALIANFTISETLNGFWQLLAKLVIQFLVFVVSYPLLKRITRKIKKDLQE